MMTEAYYEMERAFLYRELCYTQSFQREFLIRKKIEKLEKEWADSVGCDVEALRKMALDSFEYSYRFKKRQKYQF